MFLSFLLEFTTYDLDLFIQSVIRKPAFAPLLRHYLATCLFLAPESQHAFLVT